MTETEEVLFSLLISLDRVMLIEKSYLKPYWSQLDVKLGLYQLNFSNFRHRKTTCNSLSKGSIYHRKLKKLTISALKLDVLSKNYF